MSILVLQNKVLLRPSDLQPLHRDYEVIGVFNPAAVRFGDEIVLLARVAEWPKERPANRLVSPRVVCQDGRPERVLDTFDPAGVNARDPRVFWLPDKRVRLRYISHLRLVRLDAEGTRVKAIQAPPALQPCEPWEEFGIEDPRITRIGDVYYITYVAISRQRGVATALMTTRDFQTFERHGIIFPTENKDVVLLPEKWNGHFVAYHRPVSDYWINAPSIETGLSPDGIFWGRYQFLMGPRPGEWESVKVGAGPPPVRLPEGWLLLYHAVSPVTAHSPVGRYCVGAVLLDRNNPLRVLARTRSPLLCPERPYEKRGFAPDVIFPAGAVLSEDKCTLLLFAGAADEVTAMLRISIKAILQHLEAKHHETQTLPR
ncbi:MAG: glycoside hydrolase family 130 protein [Anaerolineales bacterium]